jgi:hypothetical protein
MQKTGAGKFTASAYSLKEPVESALFMKTLSSFLPAPPAKMRFPSFENLELKTYPASESKAPL